MKGLHVGCNCVRRKPFVSSRSEVAIVTVIVTKLICRYVVGTWSAKAVGTWSVNQIGLFIITHSDFCTDNIPTRSICSLLPSDAIPSAVSPFIRTIMRGFWVSGNYFFMTLKMYEITKIRVARTSLKTTFLTWRELALIKKERSCTCADRYEHSVRGQCWNTCARNSMVLDLWHKFHASPTHASCVWSETWHVVNLSLPRAINFKFPLQPNQKYNITKYERGFHSLLRRKVIILLNLAVLSLFSHSEWH